MGVTGRCERKPVSSPPPARPAQGRVARTSDLEDRKNPAQLKEHAVWR